MLVGLSSGPFPGQRVVAKDEQSATWVYAAGPLANLVIAIFTYLLYLWHPMPGLRLIALVQVTAIGYSLLPFEPLDGKALARTHPRLVGIGGLVASLVGVLAVAGLL
jgi:hypothetical protein